MYRASEEEIQALEFELGFLDFGNFPGYLKVVASAIDQLGDSGKDDPVTGQAMNVAEEAGEFIGAYRRYRGGARRAADIEEVAFELADVVISSMIMFQRLGLDPEVVISHKLRKIVTRGYVNKE